MASTRAPSLLLALFLFAGTPAQASDEATQQVTTELKGAWGTYAEGTAEALRSPAKMQKQAAKSTLPRWTQQGTDYRVTWQPANPDSAILTPVSMRVSRAGFALPGDIVIGKSLVGDVVKMLGTPDEQGADRITYRLPGYGGDHVATLTFREKRLAAVEWSWFID